MSTPSNGSPFTAPRRPAAGGESAGQSRTRHTHKEKTYNVNIGKPGGLGDGGGHGGGDGGGDGGGTSAGPAAGGRHQGDRLINTIERIEFRSDKDIIDLAKAINQMARELHLILGMRAEELQAVLSQYQGKWFHFGVSSRVKARIVAAHLKVCAEAAKAIGSGSLKMAYSFNRHFVQPEQEAKRQRSGKTARPTFTIGGE